MRSLGDVADVSDVVIEGHVGGALGSVRTEPVVLQVVAVPGSGQVGLADTGWRLVLAEGGQHVFLKESNHISWFDEASGGSREVGVLADVKETCDEGSGVGAGAWGGSLEVGDEQRRHSSAEDAGDEAPSYGH